MELTVSAVPGYFATMALERAYLRRRAKRIGPSPADYEARDTLASLAMGTASLIAPVVLPRALRRLLLREGKVKKGVVVATIGAVAVTTAADALLRLARPADDGGDPEAPTPVLRGARQVASIGGLTAVTLGGMTACTLWAWLTDDKRIWAKRFVADLGSGPLVLAAATFAWDFIYYWNHRLQHESRFLWAIHVVHHSSEHLNLSTALRQPVADALGAFVPTSALSLAGVRPSIVAFARSVNLLYQYWIHTEVIGRLGPFEKVFNTPSHHRVHHGSNKQYLDRNHGSILIVWDRLFGTFEPEDERVVYGLTRNIETFNPLRVATHEYADIAADVLSSTTWRERLSFVFRGPGWAYQRRAEREATTPAPLVYIRTRGVLRPDHDDGRSNGAAPRAGVRPSR